MEDHELLRLLEDYQEKNNLTIGSIAKSLGVTRTTIANWKSGGKIALKNRAGITVLIGGEKPSPQCAFLSIVADNWHHLTTQQRAEIAGTVKSYAEQKLRDDSADVSEKSS